MNLQEGALPDQRVGRVGPATAAVVAALLGLLGLGIAGYAQQRLHGDVVTGLRNIGQGGAVWGLYIVFDVFFVGLAFGGIAFIAVVRLFHLRQLRPLSRIAQIMTLVSLLMAGMCVMADLGRPLHGLLNFPRYARFMSPFFGTFSLVVCTGSLATFVYLWLDGRADAALYAARGGPLAWFHRLWAFRFAGSALERRRHRRTSFWLALALLPLIVVAYSTLGFVFGIQGGRPGWYGALQAPAFLVLAALSSIGMLIVIAATFRSALRLQDRIRPELFRWLANALWVCTLVYLYLIGVKELTNRYAALEIGARSAAAEQGSAHAWTFGAMLAGFAVPMALLFAQFLRRTVSIPLVVACAVLVNVAGILERFLIVVPSQTHQMLLPYPDGSYAPTWVEYAVVSGVLAAGALALIVFAKLFPIVPVDVDDSPRVELAGEESRARSFLRVGLTLAMLAAGLGVALVGLLASARVWTEPWMDPVVPFSPLVFVAGMVLVFYSAAVYEVLPAESRSARPGPAHGA